MDSPDKQKLAAWKSGRAWMVNKVGVVPALVVDPTVVPPVPTAFGAQVTVFSTAIDALSAAAATQDEQLGTAKGTTASAASLRSTLWNVHMKPIAQVARAVIADVPSAAPAMQLPSSNVDQQGLLSAATAMAAQAGNYEQVLIANGLPSDFIAQLQDATTALDQAFTARRQATAARKEATSTVDEQFALGAKALSLINAMLVRQFGSGSALLASWDSAKRVTAGPTSTTTPTPAPIVTPVGAASHAGTVPAQPMTAEDGVSEPAHSEVRAA